MINYKKFEDLNKLKFKNKELLKQSFIHKSFDSVFNNENLEFLGDRVLGLVISKKLINIFPNEKEGAIDKKFASLVNKRTCSQIGKKLNLKKFMMLGKSYTKIKSSDEKIISDCLEALIGALFLDSGLETAEKFIYSNWENYLKKSDYTFIDPKTKLQEYSLKMFKKLPEYITKNQTGSHHNPIFKVEVKIHNSKHFLGEGNSKKKAQQNAAKKLINFLKI